MFPEQRVLWHFPNPRLIRSCRKFHSTAQIFLFASLLINSLSQGHIVDVDKTATFTSVLNASTVQEPPPFLSNDDDVDLGNLTRVYLDAHVAGYVSKGVALNITWPFETASKVWIYAKEMYGSYGHDPHIYVFLCVNTTTEGSSSIDNKYATHLEADYGFKNIVKFRKGSEHAWTNVVNETNELQNFMFFVGRIVESSSKNTIGSPVYINYYEEMYRSSARNFVFVYDVFLAIDMKQEAESFLAADSSFPLRRNDQDIGESLDEDDRVNWIKNWYWPIYSKYRGVQALRQFITNCHYYFPRKLMNRTDTEAGSYYEYTKKMNKGELVHFWSGSVGVDLRHLANFAFTWDTNDEKNFQDARVSYSMLKYQCNNNCEELPVLDQLVTGVRRNVSSNSKIDKLRPVITVISEQQNGLQESVRKRVKGTLYRPLNQSERYLYDENNELHILETPCCSCYYITCSAPYIIKWVTNIPLNEAGSIIQNCKPRQYLNSRRLQDITHTDKALQEKSQKTLSQKYTIQLVTLGIINNRNMGLLKCESIQNSTQSIHMYLTDSKLGPNSYKPSSAHDYAELFFGPNLTKALIVPCIESSLKMMPDLRIRTHDTSNDVWLEWTKICNMTNKIVHAKSVKCNVTYNPVIGFTLAYDTWPFDRVSDYEKNLYFECLLNTKPKIDYSVYITSEEQELISKFTIVDDGSEITSTARGCYLVKNSDRFLFFGNSSNFSDFPLKLIRCSTPDGCDFLRQCLDTRSDYCSSDTRRPQDVLSENIPKKAIIHLDETAPTLFTNVPAAFRCQIATFVLVPNIRFAFVLSNKTIVLLSQDKGKPQSQSMSFLSSKIGVYDIDDVSLVINANSDQGIGWMGINLNLTADVVGVMCFAPLHNSTEWVNVTRSFVAKDIKIPKIKKDSKISRRIFQKDEQHFYLNCESNGAPNPEIKWILPDTIFLLNNTLVIDNSFLKFPQMEKLFAGKYTCIASNLYGNDSYEFLLKYQESGLGWQENTGIGFSVALLVILLILIVFLLFKYLNTSRQLRDLTEEEINEFTHGKIGKSNPEGNINISLLPFDKTHILNPKELMIENSVVLGSGNFGIVHRGLLNGCPVAVKTLKSTADVLSVKSLLAELKIMSFIGDHDHVVHFYGAVIEKIQKRVVEAVVEFSPFGDLKHYLRNIFDSISTAESKFIDLLVNDDVSLTHATTQIVQVSEKKISTLTLIDWCRQIASGMNFLASKRVYHGDLAARNVLVFENNTLKITDFGMSKQLYYAASYVKKEKIALPWHWMAIETLRFQEFSIESDVWAFGVTMWEIFSLGKLPFPGLNWTPELLTILSTGMRMAKPEYCTKYVYDLMLKCWCEKPIDRPTFSQLVEIFQGILEKHRSPFIAEYLNEQTLGANEIIYLVLDEDPQNTTPTETLSVIQHLFENY